MEAAEFVDATEAVEAGEAAYVILPVEAGSFE